MAMAVSTAFGQTRPTPLVVTVMPASPPKVLELVASKNVAQAVIMKAGSGRSRPVLFKLTTVCQTRPQMTDKPMYAAAGHSTIFISPSLRSSLFSRSGCPADASAAETVSAITAIWDVAIKLTAASSTLCSLPAAITTTLCFSRPRSKTTCKVARSRRGSPTCLCSTL